MIDQLVTCFLISRVRIFEKKWSHKFLEKGTNLQGILFQDKSSITEDSIAISSFLYIIVSIEKSDT